jgi:crotonobetainyl-CoA:carnitine CoA-transferase CaiB-like acyl-CoA transferase
MTKLLSGFRIIESSMLLNGAATGMMLADLGADVIKIESPFLGDYLRVEDTAYMHTQASKNKRSLALDLRTDGGREILYRLLATADGFLTNAVANRNDKLGIGYEQLRQRKPDIVYCQNTGFGATGPYAELPVHGQMMDALAGALPVEMGEDGLTRPRPVARRAGTMAAGGDGTATGAVYAALHIAAALARRERTGQGCYIDVSSAEAVVANAWVSASNRLNCRSGVAFRTEEELRGVARYQWYETRDAEFVLFCPEEKKFWEAFCMAVDRSDLVDMTYGVELRHEIQALFWTRTRAEWIEFGIEHRIPIGPAYDRVEQVRTDRQIRSRNLFIDGTDERGKPFTYIGQPAQVDGPGPAELRPAPALGEQTDEILRELGFDPETIARFAADHVTTAVSFDHDHIATVQPSAPDQP